jgi:hypothetical protein
MSETNLPVIGWSVNYNTKEFSIDRKELLDLFTKHGIPVSYAMPPLTKNSAIRAIRNVTRALSGKKLRFKSTDEEGLMVMIIGQIESDVDYNANVRQVSKAVYNKAKKTLVVEGEYQKEIHDAFERAKTGYEENQFRSIVLDYLKEECKAVSYLPQGNIYVVSKDKREKLEAVADLFADMGKEMCEMRRKEEYDTAATRSVLWDVAFSELLKEIDSHKADLEEKTDVSERGFATRIRDYKDLETRAKMWSTVLQGKSDDLLEKVDGLTKALQSKLELNDE